MTEQTSEEVQAAIARILDVDAKRRMARFLGAEDPRTCIVPGHAWVIGDRWVGPPYEEAWATFARAGFNGACECGWQSPGLHRDFEHWVDHLHQSDVDWDEVEREFTMRSLGQLPKIVARPWHK